MTEQHPITHPSLELVQQWATQSPVQFSDESWAYELFIVDKAVRFGADQELEACCEWLREQLGEDRWEIPVCLRIARRPEPPSLKAQALGALYAIATGADDTREFHQDLETIKTALESLPE